LRESRQTSRPEFITMIVNGTIFKKLVRRLLTCSRLTSRYEMMTMIIKSTIFGKTRLMTFDPKSSVESVRDHHNYGKWFNFQKNSTDDYS